MADRPILFSAPMVRAILAGTKTQTRRYLDPQPAGGVRFSPFVSSGVEDGHGREVRPRYRPGDRLWVRERLECANGDAVGYPADKSWLPNTPWTWKRRSIPSIHMPRWASRITLLVDEVRVQRLHDISEADAVAEGAPRLSMDDAGKFHDDQFGTHYCGFAGLWAHINGLGAWEANPWVAAVTFRPVLANIDEVK